jgi:hypothetical protein
MSEDSTAMAAQLARAEAALRGFAQGPAQRAADDVAAAFERAGARMAKALEQAAQGGEGALRGLVKTTLEELARLAMDRLGAGSGGHRGAPMEPVHRGAGGVTVHVNVAAGGDGAEARKHGAQIAAHVARAVAYGRRNL